MDNILVINKPLSWTSMDVIRKARNLTGIKKIGHAGTLDPLATGVLLLCLNNATKKIEQFMDLKKEYIAEINLTSFSETGDLEGKLTLIDIKQIPTEVNIQKHLNEFVGEIYQTPPKYSALKINGVSAYKLMRQGKNFNLNSRLIKIYEIKILLYEWPILKIKVICSRGTYIRALAEDIGKKMDTGGFLKSLIRTAIGNFRIENALSIEDLSNIKY